MEGLLTKTEVKTSLETRYDCNPLDSGDVCWVGKTSWSTVTAQQEITLKEVGKPRLGG